MVMVPHISTHHVPHLTQLPSAKGGLQDRSPAEIFSKLPSKTRDVLLGFGVDTPMQGDFWALPMMSKDLRGVPGVHGLYSDHITAQPLFSTDDQVLGSKHCIGLLQFVKPYTPHSVVLMKNSHNPGQIDVITPQKRWVITDDPNHTSSADLSKPLKVGLRVGAPAPGHKASVDHMLEYAVYGPHLIGRYFLHGAPDRGGLYCIEPSAVKPNMHWGHSFHYTTLPNDAGCKVSMQQQSLDNNRLYSWLSLNSFDMPGLTRGKPHSLSCTALPSVTLSESRRSLGGLDRSFGEVQDLRPSTSSSLLLAQSIEEIKSLRNKARLMRARGGPKLAPCREEDICSQVSPVAKSAFSLETDPLESSYLGLGDTAPWRSPESSYLDSSMRSLRVFPRERRSRDKYRDRRPIKALVRKASERSLMGAATPMEANRHVSALLSSSPNLGVNWWIDDPLPHARPRKVPPRETRAGKYPPKQERSELLESLSLNERFDIKEELRTVRELLARTEAAINKTGCSAMTDAAVQTQASVEMVHIGVQVEVADKHSLLGNPVDARSTKPTILMELETTDGVDVGSAPVSTRATSSAPVSVIHEESKSPLRDEYCKVAATPNQCNLRGKAESSCFCGAMEMIRSWRRRR